MAWAAGAALVVPRPGPIVGEPLAELLRSARVSHALIPPTVLGSLEGEPLEALRTLVVGGEACSPELVERWSSGRRMVNAYGPTEATACVTLSDPLQGTGVVADRPTDLEYAVVCVGWRTAGCSCRSSRRAVHRRLWPGARISAPVRSDVGAVCSKPVWRSGDAELYRTGDLARWNQMACWSIWAVSISR